MKRDDENKKPKRKRRNRKGEILQVTTDLFAKHGFQGTSLAMVADAVGLTEPGVLHYFPSKVHLLQGVLAYRDQQDFEKFSRLIETKYDTVEEFFDMLGDIWTQHERIPALIQLFTVLVGESITNEHPSHDYFVERYHRGREIYVKHLLQANVHPDVDLDGLASLLLAVTDGLHIQWLLEPDSVNLVSTFKLFSEIIVSYLEKKQT